MGTEKTYSCQGRELGERRGGRLGLADVSYDIQKGETARSYCIAQGATDKFSIPWKTIMGKNTKKNAYVCITESFCCTAEINSIFISKSTIFSSVQFSRSVVSNSLQPYELQHARPHCPSSTSRVYLNLCPIELVMPSSHLILCRPLLLRPPISPSIRVFSNESILRMRWPKYWSFSFSISPSNGQPGLIAFRMN